MSVAYACLCAGFWANAVGLTKPEGFALSMGLVQVGYFILYLVCGIYFLKHGDLMSGGIYIVFAAVFGAFGGLGNIGSAIAGIKGIPFDGGITSVSFIVSGFFLLCILPCFKSAPASAFIVYLSAGIGVVSYGFAGFTSPEILNTIGGWCIGLSGLLAFYLGVGGFLQTAGIHLPAGKPLFK